MQIQMKQSFRAVAAVLVLLLVSCALTFGQATATASLTGTVSDATGAVLPGATVTITNQQNGIKRTATSSSTGDYRFDSLPPGSYTVKASKTGFAVSTASGVVLAVGATTSENFAMKPGSENETVEVTAESPIIDVDKTSVSTEITPTQVENLPLSGRDAANLAYLAPGVIATDSYDPTKNRYAILSVNGQGGRNVNTTVNGIDNKDNTVGGAVMQLPMEAVQEFKISTQRFSAENGRSEGRRST
ncbi:MAG: carboxypeptidase regulatory-like domain-containing protein [Terriglobales bacterium]